MLKIAACLLAAGALLTGQSTMRAATASAATPQFNVLAFYTGPAEGDAAHVSFETEARAWFPQVAS